VVVPRRFERWDLFSFFLPVTFFPFPFFRPAFSWLRPRIAGPNPRSCHFFILRTFSIPKFDSRFYLVSPTLSPLLLRSNSVGAHLKPSRPDRVQEPIFFFFLPFSHLRSFDPYGQSTVSPPKELSPSSLVYRFDSSPRASHQATSRLATFLFFILSKVYLLAVQWLTPVFYGGHLDPMRVFSDILFSCRVWHLLRCLF